MATYQACQVIGLPECRINLAVSLNLLSAHFKRQLANLQALRRLPCRSAQIHTRLHGIQESEYLVLLHIVSHGLLKRYTRLAIDDQAETLATQTPLPPIPLQIRNAPTQLMRKLGYGREYAYNPDYAHPVHNVSYLSLIVIVVHSMV